jgi:hypothetical protein
MGMSASQETPTPAIVAPRVLHSNHLKALKLPTFAREYEKVAMESAQDRADYPRYLLRLCELERIDRERRNVERRTIDDNSAALANANKRRWRFPGFSDALDRRRQSSSEVSGIAEPDGVLRDQVARSGKEPIRSRRGTMDRSHSCSPSADGHRARHGFERRRNELIF